MPKRRAALSSKDASRAKRSCTNGSKEETDFKEDIDATVYSTLKKSYSKATYDVKAKKYTYNIQLTSDALFSLAPMTLSEGLFKGRQALMVMPETAPQKNAFRLMHLPAEVRTMVFEHVFQKDFDYVILQDARKAVTRCARLDKVDSATMRSLSDILDPITRTPVFHFTAVFSTNRQVYSETVPLFFRMKTFHAYHMRRMAEFLASLGEMIKYVRHIAISSPKSRSTKRLFSTVVSNAINLESLALPAAYWLHDLSGWTMIRPSYFIHHNLVALCDAHKLFREMLIKLYASQSNVEKLVRIIRWPGLPSEHIARFQDRLRKILNKEVARRRNTAARERANAEKQDKMALKKWKGFSDGLESNDDDDEDDGEYDDTTELAPPRRETGRPKRHSKMQVVRYSE